MAGKTYSAKGGGVTSSACREHCRTPVRRPYCLNIVFRSRAFNLHPRPFTTYEVRINGIVGSSWRCFLVVCCRIGQNRLSFRLPYNIVKGVIYLLLCKNMKLASRPAGGTWIKDRWGEYSGSRSEIVTGFWTQLQSKELRNLYTPVCQILLGW
jgi:hypothetical protein